MKLTFVSDASMSTNFCSASYGKCNFILSSRKSLSFNVGKSLACKQEHKIIGNGTYSFFVTRRTLYRGPFQIIFFVHSILSPQNITHYNYICFIAINCQTIQTKVLWQQCFPVLLNNILKIRD